MRSRRCFAVQPGCLAPQAGARAASHPTPKRSLRGPNPIPGACLREDPPRRRGLRPPEPFPPGATWAKGVYPRKNAFTRQSSPDGEGREDGTKDEHMASSVVPLSSCAWAHDENGDPSASENGRLNSYRKTSLWTVKALREPEAQPEREEFPPLPFSVSLFLPCFPFPAQAAASVAQSGRKTNPRRAAPRTG